MMERKLLEAMKADEKLLWKGTPATFKTMDETNKKSLLVKTILLFTAMFLAVIWYIRYSMLSGVPMKISALAIIVFLLGFPAIRPYMDASALRKKTIYGLTDQKLIAIAGGNVRTVSYDAIKDYAFQEDEDGVTSLLCGEKALRRKAHTRRAATMNTPAIDDKTEICLGYVLYALNKEDVKAVKDILSRYIPQ